MNAETRYWIELEEVTIEAMSNFLDAILDLGVSHTAKVEMDFGLEPGTYRVTVVDSE